MDETQDAYPRDRRVENRAAELLPEEVVAGSDDPEAQAAEILRDSDLRSAGLESLPHLRAEHRSSDQTVTPD